MTVATVDTASSPDWGPWVARGIVVLVLAAVYVRTLDFGLYLDDQHHARPWTLREVLGTFHGPFDPLGIEPVYYRPLVVVTFAVDWGLWGYDATGYHLTNILLHAAACIGVLELVRRTGQRLWAAVCAAVLFAVIPANVATVVYISERSDAMVALFSIATLLAIHRFHRDRRTRWLVVACLAYVLAIGSKEVGIATVALVAVWWWYLELPEADPPDASPPVLAWWRRQASDALRAIVAPAGRRAWFVVVTPFVAITAVYVVVRQIVLPNGALGAAYDQRNPVVGFVVAVLQTFKGMPWEVRGWSVVPLVVIGALALAVAPTSRHWRTVVLGVAWVACCCLPLARLGKVEPRLLYVAQVGAAIVFAGVLGVIADGVATRRAAARAAGTVSMRRRLVAVGVAVGVLLVGFASITMSTNIESQDLFEPGSPKMLGADLKIWETPRLHERFPEHYVVLIEQRLRAAGLIP